MPCFLRSILWPLALLLAFLPAMAMADPPARVGRLAYIENGVNFQVDRSTERQPAMINWPLSSGALLDTDWRGRAEAWVGSSAFRVAGNSELEFVQIDDQAIKLNLSAGSLSVSILDQDQAADLIISTPEGDVRFATPGRYRIDVFADHSEITAQAGQARIDERGRQIAVGAGQKAQLYRGEYPRLDNDLNPDTFDSWVAERENVTMAHAARRHVSPQMTGYQDLDAYGDWRPAAEYGTVWYPRSVASDWAPYRSGRWAWVAPWGWTWIDQAPWGFAPFHYGRWINIQNRWAWAPGRNEGRPIYAPALVGWIGNPGWQASFSFGAAPAVGWFPLGPREVYVPAYRYSPAYARQINIGHVHDSKMIDRALLPDAHEHFAYREHRQAVTVVPTQLMREGRTISRQEMRRPEPRDLENAPPARHAPNAHWLAPRREVRPEIRPEPQRDNPAFQPRSDAERHGDNRRQSGFEPAPILRSAPANNESRHESRNETRRVEQPAMPPAIFRQEPRENRRIERQSPPDGDAAVMQQREMQRNNRRMPREGEATESRQREIRTPQIQPAPQFQRAAEPPREAQALPQSQPSPQSSRQERRSGEREQGRRQDRGEERAERGERGGR